MKILLLGGNGQVGWELRRSLAVLGEVLAPDRAQVDLADSASLVRAVRELQPEAIVNAAAYTDVDRAENDPGRVHAINATAPGVLAREAASGGAWLLHFSTDFVFDGSGERPWREGDPTGPLNVYGACKLEGERRIAAHGPRHLILRTGWVYSARGHNFALAMLRQAREREALTVVDDQFGAPTSAELLADVAAHVLRQALSPAGDSLAGLYHVAAAGETSWHGYARFLLGRALQAGAVLKAGPQAVRAVPASGYPLPARRPHNTRLDTRLLRERFGLHLPAWQDGVARWVDEIL